MVRSSFACVFLQSQKRPPCVGQDEFPAEEQPGPKWSEQHQRAADYPACLLISTHFHAELSNIHTFVDYSQLRWPLGSFRWPVIQPWFSGAVCRQAHLWLQQNLVTAGPGFEKILQFAGIWRPLRAFILHERHFQEVRPSLMYVKSSVCVCVCKTQVC